MLPFAMRSSRVCGFCRAALIVLVYAQVASLVVAQLNT
jgi:hypothetical protein